MSVRTKPMKAHTPHSNPHQRHPPCEAMSWPHSTEGQNGRIVKRSMATYFPRLTVGANSDVAARAVSLAM